MTGDQSTYVALSASSRAIVSYLTGKRSSDNTDQFIQDIRDRVIGTPEISTDGYGPYKNAIREAFGNRTAHGTITKTYSVTDLAVTEASRRYSPAVTCGRCRIMFREKVARIRDGFQGQCANSGCFVNFSNESTDASSPR